MALFSGLSKFFEKFDEWIVIGLLIPFAKGIFDKFTEKGAEKATQKISEFLGINLEKAGKDVQDEIVFATALYLCGLSEDEKNEIRAFEAELRQKDPKKAQAFVLFVAKAVERHAVETKKTSGGKNNPEVTIQKNIDLGLRWAKEFFHDLLKNRSYDQKVAFLKGINVFSLISAKKDEPPALKIAKKVGATTKNFSVSIGSGQNENLANLVAKTASLVEKSKRFREGK